MSQRVCSAVTYIFVLRWIRQTLATGECFFICMKKGKKSVMFVVFWTMFIFASKIYHQFIIFFMSIEIVEPRFDKVANQSLVTGCYWNSYKKEEAIKIWITSPVVLSLPEIFANSPKIKEEIKVEGGN